LGFGEEFDDAQSFVGQTVTVSADVNEVLAPGVFTIAGTENTTMEPLRVVADPATDVEEDVAVQVTGTVMTFDPNDLSEIEGVLGDEFDESVFEDFEESEPFILATALSNDVGAARRRVSNSFAGRRRLTTAAAAGSTRRGGIFAGLAHERGDRRSDDAP
jgi:hypothetical protein